MQSESIFDKKAALILEGFEPRGRELLQKSFEFARKAHEGQQRMSGEPYIIHAVEVAGILKELKMDAVTVAAGFLHDVIEDTPYKVEDIKNFAGENVAFLVEGVSHVTAKVFRSKGQVFGDALKKMFMAMSKDIRVIIIKLADRLHNMRTIKYLSEERQKAIAHETLGIYAPLAHRLGMSKIKSELEDISFGVLNPQAYREIALKVSEKKEERERRIENIKRSVLAELEKTGVKSEVFGRSKHFYSIYNKMIRDNRPFESIYDLIALRVITDSQAGCYTALGIIHTMFKPIPGRFKDYIAMPKQNMYRSLHTTVLDEKGRPVEFQIRTREMDVVAEDGIAAHWSYKEEREYDQKNDAAYMWVKQLLDWNTSGRDSEDFVSDLKVDLFDEEVFVFTPKGEVKELTKGSTVLDFAYSVHSGLGDRCVGAKVNGKLVTLKYEPKNGDIIEILTGPSQHPSIDWLKFAKTTKAKNRIRHWLRTNQGDEENIQKGRGMLERRLSALGLEPAQAHPGIIKKVLDNYNLKDIKDLHSGIGSGEFSDNRVANYIRKYIGEEKKEQEAKDALAAQGGQSAEKTKQHLEQHALKGEIVVQGEYSDISYKLAKCCTPVPGDLITAVFTKKGLSIHRANCQNLLINKITAPIVPVTWSASVENYYMCRLKISANNRDGVVHDVLNTLSGNNAFISSLSSGITAGNSLLIDVSVKVKGQQHVAELINSIKKIKGIDEVQRQD